MDDYAEGLDIPEGYPLPSVVLQLLSVPGLSTDSSNTQPSIHASRVTFAATLAAPTILNLESALLVTVKSIPGKREERYAS